MLTQKQKEILDYIKDFESKNGYGPSLDETARYFGKVPSTIHQHIKILTEKGYLKKLSNQPRSIGSFKETDHVAEIPLLGKIAAGEPIEPIENKKMITISKDLISTNGSFYALEVKGDSMIEEGILDGDIAIIKHQNDAQNGDIVVAVTEYGATLKKFYRHPGKIELRPRNPKLVSIFYNYGEVEIRGKFTGLLRLN